MAVAPAFVPTDELLSSCAEEDALHVREPSTKARSLRRVVAATAATALAVASAGTWWAARGGPSTGDQVTGMEEEELSNSWVGCSNWKGIELDRKVVENEAACETWCTSEPQCVSYNWQSQACEHGWPVSNGCLLFKGTCDIETNTCWHLYPKTVFEVEQTLTLTVKQPQAPAGRKSAADIRLIMHDALVAAGVNPVEVEHEGEDEEEKEAPLIPVQSEWEFEWEHETTDPSEADRVTEYGTALQDGGSMEHLAMLQAVLDALPDGCTVSMVAGAVEHEAEKELTDAVARKV